MRWQTTGLPMTMIYYEMVKGKGKNAKAQITAESPLIVVLYFESKDNACRMETAIRNASEKYDNSAAVQSSIVEERDHTCTTRVFKGHYNNETPSPSWEEWGTSAIEIPDESRSKSYTTILNQERVKN